MLADVFLLRTRRTLRGFPHSLHPKFGRLMARTHSQSGTLIAESLLKNSASIATIVKAMGTQSDRNGAASVKRIQKTSRSYSNMSTKYGTVSRELEVELTDGSFGKVYCNNPFALLSAAATVCNAFGRFLVTSLSSTSTTPKLMFYTDSTRPGNTQCPGHARSYEALLFTIDKLPTW